MKRFIILFALMGVMFAMSPSTAQAVEGTVSATVTPSFISLLLSTSTIDYGTLNLLDVDIEPSGQNCAIGTPAFTITNNGTAAEKFEIKGADSTPGTWAILGGAGANSYVHRFITDSPTCSAATALTETNQTLDASVAKDGFAEAFLNLDMPTTSSSNETQTLPVIIIASAA